MTDREDRYRRALRWYPSAWRRKHGAALVGDLMEQDDARGRSRPSVADRAALARHGVRARFGGVARPGRFQLVALLVAVAFMGFYESVIAWTSGGTPPGGVGPFSNALIVPAALLLMALVLAVLRRAPTARLLAWFAVLSTLVVAGLAAYFHWQGPSSYTATLIVLLALGSAAPVLRPAAASAAVVLGVVLFGLLLVVDPFVDNLSPDAYAHNPLVGIALLAGGVAGAVGIAFAAWRLSPTSASRAR